MKRKKQNFKKLVFLGFILLNIVFSCKNTNKKANENVEEFGFTKKATIAYFHGDRRCPTCITVGDLAKNTYESFFKENQDVEFYEINIDKDNNIKIAEKYEVAGSALIIIGKNNFQDITGFAFKNATTNPELIKNKIIELVNQYLED